MTRLLSLCVLLSALAACAGAPTGSDISAEQEAQAAARRMVEVTQRIEPVVEQVCLDRAPNLNCDFDIVIDTNPASPPNAFQTFLPTGRPIIVLTASLILTTQNEDEVAFILSHEAAHHIQGHIDQQRRNAAIGAAIMGQMVGLSPDPRVQRDATAFGAAVGARTYAKQFELEADRLGTIITALAGFDPLRGAQFFLRIPDPGNMFLGTHPGNVERMQGVVRTVQSLR